MHHAKLDKINVRYRCEGTASCEGWEPPISPFTQCKHSTITLLDEQSKAVQYCLNPPSPYCPTSPYSKQILSVSDVHRDLDVQMDQIKWHIDEYGVGGREKDDVLVLLDESIRRAKELTSKALEVGKQREGSNPWK